MDDRQFFSGVSFHGGGFVGDLPVGLAHGDSGSDGEYFRPAVARPDLQEAVEFGVLRRSGGAQFLGQGTTGFLRVQSRKLENGGSVVGGDQGARAGEEEQQRAGQTTNHLGRKAAWMRSEMVRTNRTFSLWRPSVGTSSPSLRLCSGRPTSRRPDRAAARTFSMFTPDR